MQQDISISARPRLFLITPTDGPDDRLLDRVAAALSGGDVASLLIDGDAIAPGQRQTTVKSLVRICHEAGVAALVRNDTQLTGRAGADGVHVDADLSDLDSVLASFRPKRIVGVGNLASRHDALIIGDKDVDYVFFGQLGRHEDDMADPVAISMAEWWSPIIEIPCIVLAGKSEESVEDACETGAEFVGIRAFAWDSRDGPADAIRKANDILDRYDAKGP